MDLKSHIHEISGATSIIISETVQTLWSGYGQIERYFLEGGNQSSVVVKHIQLPEMAQHPRGWNTNFSHQRKLTSYQVERIWYEQYAHLTNQMCRVPNCFHTMETETSILLILEDLNGSGYSQRMFPEDMTLENVKGCLKWLANFHANFMLNEGEGLWPIGTYWHLDTRPEELEKMKNIPLKRAAEQIDAHLNQAKFQSLVHGDAKLANFCFSGESGKVAAVDFQYVGRGCGMKDVAYFISSCFDEEDCEKYEQKLLQYYFEQLEVSVDKNIDFQSLKEEWYNLYKYAWADFYRFLDGWSPGHWKMHGYSKQVTNDVLIQLSK